MDPEISDGGWKTQKKKKRPNYFDNKGPPKAANGGTAMTEMISEDGKNPDYEAATDFVTAMFPQLGLSRPKRNSEPQPIQEDVETIRSAVKEVPEPANVETLQTPEQRRVLDAIDQLRNCGLDKDLSLPQLVVCGDQSAGKSSVLEALTEINFPRADNLCTRFATEIILRRDNKDHLTVKIIPDEERPQSEVQKIKSFTDSVTDFSLLSTELPRIIESAKTVMGIGEASRTFASDILSIEIRGPNRAQFTVVDLPGLIQNEMQKGDRDMVDSLTKRYISQSRTICLAVITAMNDPDNQRILTFVKEADPSGLRSLGIVTKPDILPSGSGMEQTFINLAANKHSKYFFKLGWHVLKNRRFEEATASFRERNRLEEAFFKSSNFKQLAKDSLGILTLRVRLSQILFDHIKRELPGMRKEVEKIISDTQHRLKNLGLSRSTPDECREYLMRLGQQMHEVSKSAITGLYDNEYFHDNDLLSFTVAELDARRLRAVLQKKNEDFAANMRQNGYTLHIDKESEGDDCGEHHLADFPKVDDEVNKPLSVTHSTALAWVNRLITRNRGQELQGNFNPLVISQMFWFQSRRWKALAEGHIAHISKVCVDFTYSLLSGICAPDVRDSLWAHYFEELFKARELQAYQFLEEMMSIHRNHPINHNHYYTDTIQKVRQQRKALRVEKHLAAATQQKRLRELGEEKLISLIDPAKAKAALTEETEQDPKKFACEEALDCMRSIYKVKEKVFVDNVVSFIIEGRIVRELENIFSPSVVHGMHDEKVESLASELDSTKRERLHCRDQLEKLQEGLVILKGVLK